MKNYLIIIKLILIPYIFFCQGVITPELSEIINNNPPNKLIPIIIEVNDDFDLESLSLHFKENNTPIKKRASIICEQMTTIAQESQEYIINEIKSKPTEYSNLKSSWIVNCIFLNASNLLIKNLAFHPNIKRIQIKDTQADIIDYIVGENENLEIENGTEPGIEAINVRPLWEMGYTGKSTLVFNYDTGVWAEHNAFSDRFFGNFYPMNQCWDGYFSQTPNGHVSDHGTHTLGTMAGLVSQTNDTIGIAFNSYWIANDFVTSTVATLPPIEDMITSFEWALNPDGNTSTDYDVPDVINNSWRWYNEIDTFQCSGYAVQLMNVIEVSGIANIFSAGNNGPNNTGVRAPQRINSNLVNTFCVGSINANNDDYQISSFSCRGPTQCPGEGSLAIYPEVVAPGQNIRSAWGQDGFNSISGTSMASPHVSGAVLLLKEAFPFLTGQELLLALYNTASDLGEIGEDNTFGMGIIDAYAAFNFLANNYDPLPPNYISNDLVLEKITNIPNEINCEGNFNPILHIINNTNYFIDSLIVFYKNYSLLNTEEDSLIIQANLNPNETTEFEFENIINNYFGDNEFGFRIESLDTLLESDYHNNRKMVRFKSKPTITMPFIENFQNGISNELWHIENEDYSRTWDTITTAGLNLNNISAYVNLFGYDPRAEQKDELISPNILLNSSSPQLSFKFAYQKYSSSTLWQDTLQVLLSTNCGQTFNDTLFSLGGEDLSTYDENIANFIPSNDTQWQEEIIPLSNYLDQNIMLKFVTTNSRGNNIFIDNIIVQDENNALVSENKNNQIYVFPNPSKGIFKLLFNNTFVYKIDVFNIVGEQIINSIELNKIVNNFELNLEKIKSGLYFVSIETLKGKQKVIIIKN